MLSNAQVVFRATSVSRRGPNIDLYTATLKRAPLGLNAESRIVRFPALFYIPLYILPAACPARDSLLHSSYVRPAQQLLCCFFAANGMGTNDKGYAPASSSNKKRKVTTPLTRKLLRRIRLDLCFSLLSYFAHFFILQ